MLADDTTPRRRIALVAVVVLALALATITAASSQASQRQAAAPTPVRAAAAATPTAVRTRGPTPTPVPLPKADTVTRAGVPKPPIELSVPFIGGTWPLGIFVLEVRESAAKKEGHRTVGVELGILNEASQPLVFAAAGQYKEAVSLYSAGRWRGLFFVGFRTAAGLDVNPSEGSGSAELPPGVWGQTHLELDVPQADALPDLRVGTQKDNMVATALEAVTLKPNGQPWAAAGAGPTPVVITATPAPARSG